MSILIKGMKMPQNCYHCRFSHFTLKGGGGVCLPIYKECDGTFRRRKDCPLIEIPDHGDLVDRDELYVNTMDYCDLEEKILNAPAVIPAERSEE